ncbi:MAG TPA: LytTR family DNA-binding domain-containing protein [Clostridiaceae bacterium]
MLKIRIEIINDLAEDEVIICCSRVDETIQKIHHYVLEQSLSKAKIIFYKKNHEFYFPFEDVLFFETEDEHIYAHTANDAYRVKYRLYELENILPRYFVRVAKSAIVNIMQIYSVTRNLTASSRISFIDSHKHVYVSRSYYRELQQRLDERSNYDR